MKRHATLPVLAGLALVLATGGALADESQRQVWRDSEDQIVHNTWGTCVRSRWNIGVDPCAPVVAYQPLPAVRTIIAEADRTVYFPFNKSELTPESQQRLDQLAQRINAASDIQDAQVVGYADRIGTTSYNQALSKKRAETVRDYLIGRNVITEQDTMTRWVGKSQSNAQCAPNLTHDQLIQCLAPDRKVTVDLKYKQQIETQPQTNAVPQGPLMGQPPLAPATAAHAQPIPYEAPRGVSTHYPPYPMERNGVVPAYPLEQSSEADQAVVVHPMEEAPAVQPYAAPANAPGSVQTYPLSQPSASPSVQTYPLQQSSADMKSAAPPEPQPNSASPTAYEMQASPDAGQYAETEYQAEYPPSDHPADQSQPSDQYRERYLTTGE